MPGDIVNLKRWWKAADRAARENEAVANRRKSGRTKATRQQDAIEIDQQTGALDRARRASPLPDQDPAL